MTDRYRVDGLLADSCPITTPHGPHQWTLSRGARHCPGHPAPPPEQLGAGRPTASQITDDQLDALHAEVEQLRSALDWQTSCLSCARVLESSYAETARAERAEQQLAQVRAEVSRAIWALRNPTPAGSEHYRAGWDAALDAAADAASAALDSEEQPGKCQHPSAEDTGIRGLLEHVGIDTRGTDITVDGDVVDHWNAPQQLGPAAEGSTPC